MVFGALWSYGGPSQKHNKMTGPIGPLLVLAISKVADFNLPTCIWPFWRFVVTLIKFHRA